MILTVHRNLLKVPRSNIYIYIFIKFKEEACTRNMPLKISQIYTDMKHTGIIFRSIAPSLFNIS